MFILSQKQDTIVYLDNVQILRVNKDKNTVVANGISGETEVVLGTYKTYQKALDQLWQIALDCVDGKKIYLMPAEQ